MVECIEFVDLPDGATVPVEQVREFKMLFGNCVQSMRYGRAFRALRAAGLPIEARAAARAAPEYAATAQYVYLRVGGLGRLFATAQAAGISIMRRMARWSGNEMDAARVAALALPEGKRLPDVPSMVNQLDPGETLSRPIYGVLSQSMHVTSTTLAQYLRLGGSDTLHLDHQESEDDLSWIAVYAVAAACMLSTWVLARAMSESEMRAHLDHRSDVLMIPRRLDEGGDAAIRT